MNLTAKRGWLPWIGLAILLGGAGISVTLPRAQPVAAPLLVLQRPFSPPVRLRDQVESQIPNTRSWAWAHHMVAVVFGKRRLVNLDAESFAFDRAFSSRGVELELGPPAFVSRTDASVWFLTYAEIAKLRARLESAALGSSYRCRVNTADGVGAAVFVGSSIVLNGQTNQLGIHQNYYALVGSSRTDLYLSIQLSEIKTNLAPRLELAQPTVFIETNVDLAVRIQVPARRGVFLVKRQMLEGRSAGLVLDPL